MGPKIVIMGGGIAGLTAAVARNALVRAMPLSVQLRQLDLVVGRPLTKQ
jgi:uncharacterized protein with NAD-binding domain and iron-sulfur cluster